MKIAALFAAMCILAGVGGVAGALLGNAMGHTQGGALAGGLFGGALCVVAAGVLAVRLGWIQPAQRFWTIVGGLLGVGAAALVTLSTISTPAGPAASTLMVGMGATLGSRIGLSAHVRLDA